MEPLPVDILQLRRRDPTAWSALLARFPETSGVIVTAVTSEPLCATTPAFSDPSRGESTHRLRRYVLTLADCSDPISFIVKQTNAAEAFLYNQYGDPPGTAMPACHYAYLDGEDSWVVLEDIADHYPPHAWVPDQVDEIVETLARLHAARWNHKVDAVDDDGDGGTVIPHFLHRPGGPYTWEELRRIENTLFEDGPAAILSRHAINNAGRLAPAFLRAANGLVIMRDLGGWPGVMGESHLSAVADLLDDPVPMLAPLLDLPITLLHGAPYPSHWRSTLFDEKYLVDWSEARLGPGVLDLIAFIEGYPLIHNTSRDCRTTSWSHLCLREMSPLMEETWVDTYLLTLSAELSRRLSVRAFRAALPAARCLHVLLTWFPYFATWSGNMPDKYVWQRVNRISHEEASRYHNAPDINLRLYLAGVFDRFLRACRSL